MWVKKDSHWNYFTTLANIHALSSIRLDQDEMIVNEKFLLMDENEDWHLSADQSLSKESGTEMIIH